MGILFFINLMENDRLAISKIFLAIRSSRIPVLTIALAHLAGLLIGIMMAHSGIPFALDTRGSIVGRVYNGSDPTINAMQSGQPLLAAFSDFGANLFQGAVTSTLSGFGVIFPYPIAIYRG